MLHFGCCLFWVYQTFEIEFQSIMGRFPGRWRKMRDLVGCFGFNSPLRQYFSLYQAVSQREGEREEKG